MPQILLILALTLLNAQVRDFAAGSVAMTVACERGPTQRLVVTVTNTGTSDTASVLGTVLGNGRTYMVQGLTLSVERSGRQTTSYDYRPRRYPAVVAGTISEWIEPFPTQASYVMHAESSDFWGLSEWPDEAQVSLTWQIHAPQTSGIPVTTFWTGTLQSNRIRLPAQCKN